MAEMLTAEQMVSRAIAERAAVSVDHQTKAFVGFRFHLSGDARPTVVRVRRDAGAFAALAQAAA